MTKPELVKVNKMFEEKTMDYFLDLKHCDDRTIEKQDEIDEGWYHFCFELLCSSNEIWLKQMDERKLFHKPYIFETIQVSDIALTMWTVNNRCATIKARQARIQHNPDAPVGSPPKRRISGRQKGIKTGPHESKDNMQRYIDLYNFINTAYDDDSLLDKWNKKFWDKMEQHHPSCIMMSSGLDKGKKRSLDDDQVKLNLPSFDRKKKRGPVVFNRDTTTGTI